MISQSCLIKSKDYAYLSHFKLKLFYPPLFSECAGTKKKL